MVFFVFLFFFVVFCGLSSSYFLDGGGGLGGGFFCFFCFVLFRCGDCCAGFLPIFGDGCCMCGGLGLQPLSLEP